MKRNKYKILIIFVVALFVFVPGIVFAAKIVESSKVTYDNSKTGLPNNVQGAIDALYTRQNVDLNNWKQKYYDLVSKNANNAPLVDFIRGVLKNDGKTILQDDGTAGHNMRYIGANPNNWISFNGEKWRIIGIFGEDSHGQSDELIKIQYSGFLDVQWNENNINDWSSATLKTYLNSGEYYTNTLKSDAKKMIQTVDWKLGASKPSIENTYADALYNVERGVVGAGSNPSLLAWLGDVALSYPSDYLFSTNGGVTHNRTACLGAPARTSADIAYNDFWRTDGANAGECATGSWMIQQVRSLGANMWTLTPISNSTSTINSIFASYYDGPISTSGPANDNSRESIPAVYLKYNVICTNCAEATVGTESNPFKIKLG